MFPDTARLDCARLVCTVSGRPPIFGDLPILDNAAVLVAAMRAFDDVITGDGVIQKCDHLFRALGTTEDGLSFFVMGKVIILRHRDTSSLTKFLSNALTG